MLFGVGLPLALNIWRSFHGLGSPLDHSIDASYAPPKQEIVDLQPLPPLNIKEVDKRSNWDSSKSGSYIVICWLSVIECVHIRSHVHYFCISKRPIYSSFIY